MVAIGAAMRKLVHIVFGVLKSGKAFNKRLHTFLPTYEERKAKGEPWPGFVENMLQYCPDRGKDIPASINWLDDKTLCRVFEAAGFSIDRVEVFARPEFPEDLRLDGRESVGMIATKP
jgi:hypothetical protein